MKQVCIALQVSRIGSIGEQGLLPDQFYLTGNFPNGSITFVSTCILCDGYLRLSQTRITYRNCECAGSHIVDFVIFPYFNTDGLESENLQGLCDFISAFDGFAVVGISERPVIPNASIGNFLFLKSQLIYAVGMIRLGDCWCWLCNRTV